MAFALKSKLNRRIGAKLAVMQGIGVMLVVGMIANAIYGNSTVKSASDSATSQQTLALDLSDARSAIRVMAIYVRDIRLAQESVDIDAAVKGVDEQRNLASKLIQQNIPRVRIAENRERLEKAAAFLDEYATVAKQVAGIRSKVMGLDVGSVRLVTADEEAARIARERITTLAGKLNEAIDRFCALHPNLAIPNLMRCIVYANAAFFALSLFAGYGSISDYIRRERLRRSLQDLRADTGKRAHVGRIARRWGFGSDASFARAFRATYGVSPTNARNIAEREVEGTPNTLVDWFSARDPSGPPGR